MKKLIVRSETLLGEQLRRRAAARLVPASEQRQALGERDPALVAEAFAGEFGGSVTYVGKIAPGTYRLVGLNEMNRLFQPDL